MTHSFGPASLRELEGVHPALVNCVHAALAISTVDFGVHDGLRTEAEQREYVRRGVSTTMNSKHMRQADGYSHAVDLVPFINGKLRWEWPPIFVIASAMCIAARRQGLVLIWGGVWDRKFPVTYSNTSANGMKQMVDAYVERRKAAGRRAFIDGPHFELSK